MFKPVIKWSGSKRSQADTILSYFPDRYDTYFEPFVGGGSIMYACCPTKAICGDICEPLIALWNKIKTEPFEVSQSYAERWSKLQKDGYMTYYEIRDEFNKTKNPYDLLFLSRTCVNGLIRFNDNGEFNNSFHYSRPGIHPDKLWEIIHDWSSHIQGVEFFCSDYRLTCKTAKEGDLVYLDPPYFHTKGRYYGTISYNEFIDFLSDLNRRGVKYILSFDGIRGEQNYTVDIPRELFVRHEYIPSGNSTFKKIMDKEKQQVLESLYLNY